MSVHVDVDVDVEATVTLRTSDIMATGGSSAGGCTISTPDLLLPNEALCFNAYDPDLPDKFRHFSLRKQTSYR